MKNKSIVILSAVAVILIVLTIIIAVKVSGKRKFIKPEFDKNAKQLADNNVDEKLQYAEINIEEGYIVGICNNLIADENGNIQIYFTSLKENNVYVKLRIYDEEDKILAETGLIKAGEQIEKINIKNVEKETNVIIKIMSYDPETYYSMGTISLNTKIKLGEI